MSPKRAPGFTWAMPSHMHSKVIWVKRFCQYRWLAHHKHATRITKVASRGDHGNVEINYIAGFQYFVARDAMANDVIDRGANGSRKGWISGAVGN
jgi:hypothetical protein